MSLEFWLLNFVFCKKYKLEIEKVMMLWHKDILEDILRDWVLGEKVLVFVGFFMVLAILIINCARVGIKSGLLVIKMIEN